MRQKSTFSWITVFVLVLSATPTPALPPSKVQGVSITRTSRGSYPSVTVSLSVSWSAVSGSGITYTVCYSTTSGTQSDPPSGANCDASGITGTSTTLSSLSIGTTYYIWLAAVSSDGQGPYSDREQERTYQAPSRVNPPILTNTVISDKPAITVTWTVPSSDLNISYYRVQYQETLNASWRVMDTSSTSTTLENLSVGTNYEVRVSAVSDIDFGLYSQIRAITTYKPPSRVNPPNLTNTVISGKPAIRVTWTVPSSDLNINYYRVQYQETLNASWIVLDTSSTSITLENLSAGTNYEVRVRAVSDVGDGLYSQIRAITTYKLNDTNTNGLDAASCDGLSAGLFVAGLFSGVIALLLVEGIICGVCKISKISRKKNIEEDYADPTNMQMTECPAYESIDREEIAAERLHEDTGSYY